MAVNSHVVGAGVEGEIGGSVRREIGGSAGRMRDRGGGGANPHGAGVPATSPYGAGVPGALLLALSVLLLLGVSPAGAAAQEEDEPETEEEVSIDTPFDWIPRSLRIGLYGGYLATDRGTLDIGPGSAPLLGARARARLSAPLSLEANVAYGSSDRKVIDPRLESGPAAVDEVDSDFLMFQVGMQFSFTGNRTWNGIQPYAIVGAGFLFGVNEDRSPVFADQAARQFEFQLNTLPTVQAGVGVEHLLNDRLGVSLELRNHFFRIETPDAFFSEEILNRIEELDVQAPQETDWTNNLGLTVTLYRYF